MQALWVNEWKDPVPTNKARLVIQTGTGTSQKVHRFEKVQGDSIVPDSIFILDFTRSDLSPIIGALFLF